MIRLPKPVLIAALAGTLLAGTVVVAGTADAGQAKPRYTNATTVRTDCPVYWNYPKPGLANTSWPAGPSTPSTTVGVRYRVGDQAVVLDYTRAPNAAHGGQFPWWGWIHRSCLVDPTARRFPEGTTSSQDRRDAPDPDSVAPALGDRQAVGGHNQVKTVDVSPEHHGEPRGTPLHFDSNATLRSGPQQFVTGNVGQGWEFRITRDKCRTLTGAPFKPSQWVFGYAPQAGRWGWVQANHLPACTG